MRLSLWKEDATRLAHADQRLAVVAAPPAVQAGLVVPSRATTVSGHCLVATHTSTAHWKCNVAWCECECHDDNAWMGH